jgi:hypothetical protein
MNKFTLRIDDEQLVKEFDELANIHGMTRTAFIIQLMQDAVNAGYVPMRDGEGYRALVGTGGEATITRHNNYVAGGMRGLNKNQEAAYELAKKMAGPEYGSQWIQARQILEKAGFKVYRL